MTTDRSYEISKQVVWQAYQRVKANRGAAGVDGQSLEAFEKELKNASLDLGNRKSERRERRSAPRQLKEGGTMGKL